MGKFHSEYKARKSLLSDIGLPAALIVIDLTDIELGSPKKKTKTVKQNKDIIKENFPEIKNRFESTH